MAEIRYCIVLSRPVRALLPVLLCACACLFSSFAVARVDIDPRPVNLTLNWVGNDVLVSQDFCVLSTQGASPANNTVIPYQVTAIGTLALVNGANQIPVSLAWQDLAGGGSTPLAAGAGTGMIMTGDTANCPGGNNGRLLITVLNSDITAVVPGAYTATFDIEVSNNGAGRTQFANPVTLDLVLPDSIMVSQLDDIDLGVFSGVDLVASESLCVYRASGGLYGVTVTGSGTGGAFQLVNNTSVLDYQVSWSDGVATSALAPGVLLSGQGNSVSGDTSCGNGAANNATLTVTLPAASVDTAVTESGLHTGVLTILVEMQ